MSSLSPVGRSTAARKNDRVSLCSFTFSDGRRCRTPRIRNHPHFCFYHAQKKARARTAETLGKDLTYFFSGDYLSACDLSTALARLIPAVVRGDIKPKTARTVAYLAQTLLQTIHLSQHEYINAFGTNGWRNSICNSVNGNRDYRFPPAPKQPAPPQPTAVAHPAPVAHPFRGEALRPAPPPQTQAQQPAPAPPSNPPQPAARPVETPVNCHSERREEPAFSPSSAPSPTSPPASQTPASTTNVTHPIPATHSAPLVAPTPQPVNPPKTGPPTPRPVQKWDPHAIHFDPSCRLLIDGKPL